MAADPAIAKLVKANAPYLELLPDGRVKCTLNGHIMPARMDVLSQFVGGPKYSKMKKRAEDLEEFKEFEPDIVQSKYHPNSLWCTLSGRLVDKKMASVRKHVEGKHFSNACDMRDAGIDIRVHSEPDPKAVAEAAERAAAAGGEDEGSGGSGGEEEAAREGSEGGSSEISIPDFVFDSDDEGMSREELAAELDAAPAAGAGAGGGPGGKGKKRAGPEPAGGAAGGRGGGEKGKGGKKGKGAKRPPMVPLSLQVVERAEAAVDAVLQGEAEGGGGGAGPGGASKKKGKPPRPEKKRKMGPAGGAEPSTSKGRAPAAPGGGGKGKGRGAPAADPGGKGKAVAVGPAAEGAAAEGAKKKKAKKKTRKGRGHGAALSAE